MIRRLVLAALLALAPLTSAFALNCSSNPFTLTNGATADATQVMANFNNLQNCANNNLAHNGANSDITSLSSLSTPLSAAQGGTGIASPTANSLLAGNGASAASLIAPGTQGQALISAGSSPAWAAGIPVVRGTINGFETGAPGGAQTLTIGPGVADDNTHVVMMQVTTTYTKTMASWAVGSGNGGLDTGSVSSSTAYFVWEIERPDTGVVDYLISLSGTAPTMPTNYTVKRGPISWFKTDGSSNIWQFQQRGDDFIYGAATLDANGITVNTTAVLTTLTVPLGFQVNALIRAQVTNASGGANLLITSPDETDQALSSGVRSLQVQVAAGTIIGEFEKRTNTSGQIRTRGDTASNTVSIGTYGFRWTRGRNS